jgi:hypothetical protein
MLAAVSAVAAMAADAQVAVRQAGTTPAAMRKPTASVPTVDKRQFNLFNPTPREYLREMSADRPDTTESPITVDAGRFQIEASFFDYGRNRDGGIEEEVFTYGALNLKTGLLHNVDLQFVFDLYTEVRTRDRRLGGTETAEGSSDLQLRLKFNLWGNDGGRTAFAFFPFIKLPTGAELSNDKVEGGVILPLSIELNDRFSLGVMAEVDFVHDGESRAYETEFVHTAVLGVSLTEKFGTYMEYVGVAGATNFDYQASISAGVTYGLSADVQLDFGGRVGLNEAAEDGGVFTGITVRF